MKVDFHCHSTASDGTFTPREIAGQAERGGFSVLALTDHDNCDGVKELVACNSGGTKFVTGIELSIDPGKGFDKFHLLGIGIDPENAPLKAFLKKILDGRNARNSRIIANFRRLGIEMEHLEPDVSPNQTIKQSNNQTIFDYAHGEVLARPHFGRWLMDHGYVESVSEAFDRYLADYAPAETRCYEERYHPSQEESFKIIHDAGGLCVMAHPKYWRRYWKDSGPEYVDAEKELARLKEAGLDGLEAIYQANTVEEDVQFQRIADRLGYLKTAGSDFHGTNKPQIHLGMEVPDSYIAPFLNRLNLI